MFALPGQSLITRGGRRVVVGGAPTSPPVPFNVNYVAIGDSRTAGTLANTNTSGSGGFTSMSNNGSGDSFPLWAESLTCGKIVGIPQRLIDFGIGSQTSQNIVTIPRATTPQKAIDYVARSPAGIVFLLMGTNDSTTSIAGADPGKGSGAVSSVNSRSNVRYIIEYLTDPVRNATINSALGIDGGVCNLYGGLPKTIILINELPRGRYVANGGATTLGSPRTDQAAFYAFSRWLLTLDFAQAGGYSNVIAVNGYDAIADYTTIPDGIPDRPVGAPAFGGGSTANNDTYLPHIGALYDGLHQTTFGGYKVGKAIADQLDAVWTSPGYLATLYPGSAADYSTRNEGLTGTSGGAPTGFASVTGSVPTGLTISGTNTTDIALTISSRTDTDGQQVIRFQGSGTSTGTAAKALNIGHVVNAPDYANGVYGPALAKGDKLRYFAKLRLLAANKLNGAGINGYVASVTDNEYNSTGSSLNGAAFASRKYLMDDLTGIDPGIDDFVPLISRVIDTTNMQANANTTNNGFNTLQCYINLSFLANATDAPIGTALAFDFEIKGVGLLKTTSIEPGYNITAKLLDFFTDTDGTALTAHTASLGAWSLVTSYTDTAAITSNRVRCNTTGFAAWQNSEDPGSDNYRVWARMRRVTGVNGAGVAARIQSGAATYYAAIYDGTAGNILLVRYENGTPTTLATTANTVANGADFTLFLEVETISAAQVQLRVLKNGVQIGNDYVDVSASRITGRGKAGITLEGSSASTGVHIDTVMVSAL